MRETRDPRLPRVICRTISILEDQCHHVGHGPACIREELAQRCAPYPHENISGMIQFFEAHGLDVVKEYRDHPSMDGIDVAGLVS